MGEISTNVDSSGINFNNNGSISSVSAIDTQKEELNKTSTDYKNNVETETMDLGTEENTLVHVTQMSKEEQVYTYETPPNYGSKADITLANCKSVLSFIGISNEDLEKIHEIRVSGPYENIHTIKFGNNNTVKFDKNTGELLEFNLTDDTYADIDITSMTNEGLKESEQNAKTFIYNKLPNYGSTADIYLAHARTLLQDIGIKFNIVKEVTVSGANENIIGIRYNYGNDSDENKFIVVDQDTGEIRRIESDGFLYTNYDGRGLAPNNSKAMDIFDDSKVNLIQYGGDQTSFLDNGYELLKNEDVRKVLTDNFPDASEEDYYLYLRKIELVGCGYVAMVNSIFDAYQGKQEEFQNTFHIPMYRLNSEGKVVFNYEPLVTSIYTYLWKDIYGYTNIEDIYGNVEELAQTHDYLNIQGSGGTDPSREDIYKRFLNDCYGLDCKVTEIPYYPFLIDYKKLFKYCIDKSISIVVSSSGYDLYSVDEKTGERGEKLYDNGGPHAMTITDVTFLGDFVVSSWGRQYIVDFKDNDWCYFTLLDIDV